jgi:signal transduction histidine kinase
MNFLKPSMLRRMVTGQLLTVVLFCVVTALNLLWQFKKQDTGGEVDRDARILAQALAKTLDPRVNTLVQMREKAETIRKLLKETLEIKKSEMKGQYLGEHFGLYIKTKDGSDIYRSPDYPVQISDVIKPGSQDIKSQGLAWRLFTWVDDQQELTIHVAQNSDSIDEDLGDLVKRFIVTPLLWFLPFAALVTYHASVRGLQPLRELAKSISRRSPTDMSPIEHHKSYIETQPIVNEINSLLLKLETTLERERHFLADAAHELRTPLAVIQAQAYVLKQAINDDAKAVAADELNAGIDRAASLIQKLLLTAKVSVENYKPRLETADLCGFVQERMASMSVLAAYKDIDMELEAPHSCKVQLDRETFISAVDNVLDNAIRYTPAGGKIRVSVELVQGSDNVVLRIADSGMGIPPELEERVFERFFRIAGSEQQGSGLGLAIVKKVLALHGGNVALASGLDQRGLSVCLTMPLQIVKPVAG